PARRGRGGGGQAARRAAASAPAAGEAGGGAERRWQPAPPAVRPVHRRASHDRPVAEEGGAGVNIANEPRSVRLPSPSGRRPYRWRDGSLGIELDVGPYQVAVR